LIFDFFKELATGSPGVEEQDLVFKLKKTLNNPWTGTSLAKSFEKLESNNTGPHMLKYAINKSQLISFEKNALFQFQHKCT
jgi:hypothetical protein